MKSMLFLLLLFCAFACTLQIVPLQYSIDQDNYQSYISVDSVDYSLEFISEENGLITFWFQVNNTGEDTVFLNEPIATFITSNSSFDGEDYTYSFTSLNSKEVSSHLKNEIKKAKTAATMSAVLGVALIVADIASDANDARKYEWDKGDENRYVARKTFTGAGLGAANIASEAADYRIWNAQKELNFLPNEVFNQSTVLPGTSHSGKLVFKVREWFDYYRIKIKSGNRTFIFDFRQANTKESKYLTDLN